MRIVRGTGETVVARKNYENLIPFIAGFFSSLFLKKKNEYVRLYLLEGASHPKLIDADNHTFEVSVPHDYSKEEESALIGKGITKLLKSLDVFHQKKVYFGFFCHPLDEKKHTEKYYVVKVSVYHNQGCLN